MTPFQDVSTVFSIAPFELFDMKPGILPGTYRIPACTDNRRPNRLLVRSGLSLMTIGGKKHPVKIETASYVIAKAIVEDSLSCQLWCNPGVENPGLHWIHGDVSPEEFILKHKEIYDNMLIMQKRWFLRVCRETDNEWSRYHHHRVVSDTARFAANALGIEPEWMKSDDTFKFHRCQVCSVMNDPSNLICTGCHVKFDDFYNKLKESTSSSADKLKGLEFVK